MATVLPIPLRQVRLGDAAQGGWADEVDGFELAQPVDWRSGPLVRAVHIAGPGQVHDLILTLPHSVADGTTALSLLRQWVRLAAAPPVRVVVGPQQMPEPLEALFPAREPFVGGPLGQGADAGAGGEVVGRLEPERFVPFDLRRTRMLHRALSGAVLGRLTAACRREGATLDGVLAAGLACAVARDAEAAPAARFAVGSRVSLREELARAVDEDEVGCFVSALHSVVSCRPDDLWAMARFVRDDIAARKKRGEQYEAFDRLAEQGPWGVADCEPFVRHLEEHGPFNFFVSNVGRFEFPTQLGSWRLSGAQFVGGISVAGYFGSSVTTSQGQLSWNFTYIDQAVSRDRAERVVDDA
ncbi:phthiocerol/phthiodiolone dimycocerosyl transferase family protein, partial [Streptacidiphilus pinicola]|uniref:phthiocerol/phthiodiolone dimycocerosyl transferase family protein n=1 Tax=Streptacidiphilus pinicola TaxID=2219663 RepID=UPI001057EB73